MLFGTGFFEQRSMHCVGLSAFVHSAAIVAATVLPNALRIPNEGTTQTTVVEFSAHQTALGDSLDTPNAPVAAEEAAPREITVPQARRVKKLGHKPKIIKPLLAKGLPKKIAAAEAAERPPIETVEESPVFIPITESIDAKPVDSSSETFADSAQVERAEEPAASEQKIQALEKPRLADPVLRKAGPEFSKANVHSQVSGNGASTINGKPFGGAPRGLPNGVKNADLLTETPGNMRPQYPVADRIARRIGAVEFLAVVNTDGSVSNISLFSSSATAEMVRNAFDAFKNWRYDPGQTGRIYKKFSFVLTGDAVIIPARLRTTRQ